MSANTAEERTRDEMPIRHLVEILISLETYRLSIPGPQGRRLTPLAISPLTLLRTGGVEPLTFRLPLPTFVEDLQIR